MSINIVIIGGVAGGMTAAARARRINEKARILVLEKGGFVSFANCGLPYYIGGRIATEEKLLVTTPQRMRQRFNIDVRVHHEVQRIDRSSRQVHGVEVKSGQPFSFPYDKLILSPGASPIIPDSGYVDAQNVFYVRSMEDTKRIHRYIAEDGPKRAVIVGAGYIGLEMAEALHNRSLDVTVVERQSAVMPTLDADMAGWVHKELAARQVELLTGDSLAGFDVTGERVTAVRTAKGAVLPTDLVVVSIGVVPNATLAQRAGLALGAGGAIAVDELQRTSDPDIYAVGDVAEVIHAATGKAASIPLAGPANRQGRTGGEHAASGSAAPAGRVLGTQIVQVFGLTVGMTGLNEASARSAGIACDTAYVHAAHHATYYPGAQPMRIKLVYEQPTGRVLGVQIAGGPGVDKRLDVIATLMHFGGTIDDLAQLDLAYAPPYASAKDPVHMVAFVAQNQRIGLTPALGFHEVDGAQIIDVRTPQEFAGGTLPGALNIPVDELRERLDEIDKSRPVAVLCQVGLRGHVATRILVQHGYQAHNIKGGWMTANSRT